MAQTQRESNPLEHLVSTYVARRELVPLMQRELLHRENEIKLEEAEILLGLFRASTGEHSAIQLDGKGFTGLRQIEAAQMLSQSQIHRRVKGLMVGNYLEEKLPRRDTSAIKVRLTRSGAAFAEQYWKDYRKFASLVLKGIDPCRRRSHFKVNDVIQRKIHGLSLTLSPPRQKVEPVDNLMSIFAAAKAIRGAIERAVVLPEDELTVESADVLVFLYTRGNDFISFGEIQQNLVHSFSLSRHLISRWISEMRARGLVERQTHQDKRRMEATITQQGRDLVKPILDRYRNLERNLMADIPEEDREAHLRINRTIIDSIRPRLNVLISPQSESGE